MRHDAAVGPWRVAGIVAVSVLLYWFGMATNDLFDVEKDCAAAPDRVLPSGRLTVREAQAGVLCVLLAAGVLSWALGVLPLAAGVAAFALAYNAGGKRVPFLGECLLASARGGNFLLGAGGVEGPALCLEDPALGAAALGTAVYCGWITWVSRLEERPVPPRRVLYRGVPLCLLPAALGIAPFVTGVPETSKAWAIASAILALAVLAWAGRSAARPNPDAPPAARWVRTALLGVPLIDAAALAAWSPKAPHGQVAALYAQPAAPAAAYRAGGPAGAHAGGRARRARLGGCRPPGTAARRGVLDGTDP